MELSNVIATTLGVNLPSTLVFDYPSISALAEHVHHLLDDLDHAKLANIHTINPLPLPTVAFERKSTKVCLALHMPTILLSFQLAMDVRYIVIHATAFKH